MDHLYRHILDAVLKQDNQNDCNTMIDIAKNIRKNKELVDSINLAITNAVKNEIIKSNTISKINPNVLVEAR